LHLEEVEGRLAGQVGEKVAARMAMVMVATVEGKSALVMVKMAAVASG